MDQSQSQTSDRTVSGPIKSKNCTNQEPSGTLIPASEDEGSGTDGSGSDGESNETEGEGMELEE